jgi:hypothetical protein
MYVKRTSTSTPSAGRPGRIERISFTTRPTPANDTSDHPAALIALVDDIATLAVALYLSGRLPEEKRGMRDAQRGKRIRDDV